MKRMIVGMMLLGVLLASQGVCAEQAAALVRRLAAEGQPLSEAAKQVAKETGYRKGDLYRLALENE